MPMLQTLGRAARSSVAGLAAIVLLVALPACSLRRFYPGYPIFEGRAIVRNAAGVEVVVTTSGDLMMENFVMATPGPFEGARERALSKFKGVLNRHLAGGASPMFRARFGEGPWCLAAEPVVLPTFLVTNPDRTPSAEGYPELPLCTDPPPPPACADPGENPLLQVDPPSHAFPDVPMGTSSDWESFVVTNGGSGHVCLASIVAGGRDPVDFEVDDADCRPTDPEMARQFIGPEGRPSCVVNVRFTPQRPGDRNGSLRVSSNAQPVLQEFGLTGRGLAGSLTLPPTPVCVPRVADPTSPGCSFMREIRLPNPGPGSVTVRSIGWPAGWQVYNRSPLGPVPPGSDLVLGLLACGTTPPAPGSVPISSDGIGVDPMATVIEIPVIAQVTPETCTP